MEVGRNDRGMPLSFHSGYYKYGLNGRRIHSTRPLLEGDFRLTLFLMYRRKSQIRLLLRNHDLGNDSCVGLVRVGMYNSDWNDGLVGIP